MRIFSCLFLFLWFASHGYSQQDSTKRILPPADSTAVHYFYLNDFTPIKVKDELKHFHRYNPVLLDEFDHQYLGNFGSPHYSMVYQPRYRRGFDLGFHNYDGYTITKEKVPFYNNNRPHTDAFYTAASQEDAYIKVKFSQNYAKRWNMYLAYNRITHKGDYDFQQVRNSNYTYSTYFRGKNDNYQLFFSWAGNTIKQKNNGGILSDTLLEEDIYRNRRDLIPVHLSTAQTEYDNHEGSITQFWSFSGLKDPPPAIVVDTVYLRDTLGVVVDTILKNIRPSVPRIADQPGIPSKSNISHQVSYQILQIKFFDNAPAEDASFYGNYQVNDRGIRHFVNVKKIENQIKGTLYFGKNNPEGFSSKRTFMLQPGIAHAFYRINQEPLKSNRNDVFLTGHLETNLKEYLNLEADAQFGVASNAGEYLVRGKLSSATKGNRIELTAAQQLFNPSLIQQSYFISQTPIWRNQFRKSLESNLGAKYSSEKWDLEAGVRYHVFNNYLYYDTLGQAAQTNRALNIIQLFARKDFQFGKFNFENKIAFQLLPNRFIDLPAFVARHSIFYESIFFKKKSMLARIGIDLRYNSPYFANSYLPQSGQFYLQNTDRFYYYPVVDVFLNAKVKRFKMSFKVENMTQLILQKSYLTSIYYPGSDWVFKFGIAWVFVD